MKKLILGIVVLGLMTLPNAYAGWECTVSSSPANNVGGCTEFSGHGDICLPGSTGPACNGTRYINEP